MGKDLSEFSAEDNGFRALNEMGDKQTSLGIVCLEHMEADTGA